jgi:hypothetical protein
VKRKTGMNKNQLLGRIAEKGFTQKSLTEEMMLRGCHMSENTFSGRINGHSSFKTTEIDTVCEILEIDDSVKATKIFLNRLYK